MVTLSIAGFSEDMILVIAKPLSVGKLDLRLGRVRTSDQNLLTVTNPDSSAVSVAASPAVTFVDGPLARATNSLRAYKFPGDNYLGILSSCLIIPTSSTNSMYQVSHVPTVYSQSGVTYPLKGVSKKEYWNITKINGSDAKVQLSLTSAIAGASASDALVVAHFVNNSWISERGTTIQPGTSGSGLATSKSLTDFGAFTFGYEDQKKDEVITSLCPNDTVFISSLCKAKVVWRVPNSDFPETLNAGIQSNIARLIFRGSFDGHGYYESTDKYSWPDANNAINQLKGHLVTISSAAENTFINTNINERENYAWIGLRNTGKQGDFAWVTGEALSYTNWTPGQPDNLYGMDNSDTTIFEPYVHINGFDSLNRWNDNGAGTIARMLAEFDRPILTYRQISGPVNSDSLQAGTYTVCYEKTNTATGIIDTCCFNITVICQPANSIRETIQQVNIVQASQNIFSGRVITNPSTTSFTIKISSNNFKEKIMVEVTDASGRIIERKSNILAENTFQLGDRYSKGVYFARISQGAKFTVLKLVKK